MICGDTKKISHVDHERLTIVMLDCDNSTLKCSDTSSAAFVRRGCAVPTTLTPVPLPSM